MQTKMWNPVAFGLGLTIALCSTQVGAQTTSDRFVPFAEFIQSVRTAASTQYVGAAQARVSSTSAFNEMRQHLLRMYDSIHVGHSYVLDSQYFDCVPINEQPSVRLLGLRNVETVPPRPSQPAGGGAGRAPDGSEPAVQVRPDQKADRFGNSIPCEAGTIPMRRITLEELSRFTSLREFFQKGPGGAGQVPFKEGFGRAITSHKYAHAYQNIANHGGASFLNLWNPKVDTTQGEIFSLSQHWYANYRGDGKVQTVEGGWQDYPGKYGVTKPVLFIYWTADGYNATGCYNLDCAGFVQTNSAISLGATFSNYSTKGGTQYDFRLQWEVFPDSGGRWWLYYGGSGAADAVGYYPSSLFSSGPLGTAASSIDYGGETVGSTVWPPMGSGKFPGKGFGYAAFQRFIYYVLTAGGSNYATLTPSQPSPSCYKIKVFNNSSDPNYHTYFYFGGRGGTGC